MLFEEVAEVGECKDGGVERGRGTIFAVFGHGYTWLRAIWCGGRLMYVDCHGECDCGLDLEVGSKVASQSGGGSSLFPFPHPAFRPTLPTSIH